MKCPICNSVSATTIIHGSYRLNECKDCTAIWTPTVVSTEYYSSEYTLVEQYSNFENHRRFIERLPEQWKLISIIQKYSQGKKLLDIGCDYGHFLDIARKSGFEVVGVEPSVQARAYCNQIGITTSEDISNVFQQKFDVITMWHCLEHIEYPTNYLQNIRDSFSHNSTLLCIRVPDFESLPSKLFSSRWIWFQPKQHHLHFTKSSLKNALTLAGFSIISIKSQRPNNLKTILGTLFALSVESTYTKRGFLATIKTIVRSIWHYVSSVELFVVAKPMTKK
jgi:cyclopropane fatty-acyl-phospholipid synthase-like methyltransferase